MDGQQIIVGFLVSFVASVLATKLLGAKLSRLVSQVRSISPSASWLPFGVVVLNAVLLACLWIAIDDTSMAMLLTGPFVLANLSGFLAGFAYRLSEMRSDLLRKARFATTRDEEMKLKRQAPSLVVVRYRAAFSGVCFFVSALAALMLIAVESDQQTIEVTVVSFVILASSMASGNLSSFMEPWFPHRDERDTLTATDA